MPGVLLFWIMVEQRPSVLAVGSWVGGVTMVLSAIICLFSSLSLSTEMPSHGAVKTKTNQRH